MCSWAWWERSTDCITVEVNQHINTQGESLNQDQYTHAQLQAVAQGIGLFNALSNIQHWDALSDMGKLSAVLGLYNSVDGLGAAFSGSGDNLPGDLGAAAGWLSLAQGLQNGDNLVIANGINIISDHALDNALGQAFGSSSAGEAVPYLSYALAIRNFADNPEQALGTVAGTYIGEGLGAALGGPIGAAIGGALGGMIGGMLGGLFGDDDMPMREGLAHAQWDANGHTQVMTTQDAEGGGSTASAWMGMAQTTNAKRHCKARRRQHQASRSSMTTAHAPRHKTQAKRMLWR